MKAYKEKVFGNMQQDKEGIFVLKSDVLLMMGGMIDYVIAHSDDIKDGVDDFGGLKSVLEMVRGKGDS